MVSYSEVWVEHYYERMEPEFHAVENARSEEKRKLREEVEKKQNQERWKRYSALVLVRALDMASPSGYRCTVEEHPSRKGRA